MVRLMTVREVAQRLQVGVPRAYQLIRDGVIPSVRIGSQVRVDPLLLDEWIARGGAVAAPRKSTRGGPARPEKAS